MSGAFSRTLLRLAMGLPVLAGEGTRVANPPGGVRGASGATRRPPWRPRSPSLRPKPPAPPDTAVQRRTTPPAPIPASAAHRPQTDVSQRSRSRPLSSIRWDRSVKHVPGPDNRPVPPLVRTFCTSIKGPRCARPVRAPWGAPPACRPPRASARFQRQRTAPLSDRCRHRGMYSATKLLAIGPRPDSNTSHPATAGAT
jgi:hypothetical protein